MRTNGTIPTQLQNNRFVICLIFYFKEEVVMEIKLPSEQLLLMNFIIFNKGE
jgi:hypothetical protein